MGNKTITRYMVGSEFIPNSMFVSYRKFSLYNTGTYGGETNSVIYVGINGERASSSGIYIPTEALFSFRSMNFGDLFPDFDDDSKELEISDEHLFHAGNILRFFILGGDNFDILYRSHLFKCAYMRYGYNTINKYTDRHITNRLLKCIDCYTGNGPVY